MIVENVVAFEVAAAVVEKYVGTSLEPIRAAMAAMHDAEPGEDRGLGYARRSMTRTDDEVVRRATGENESQKRMNNR